MLAHVDALIGFTMVMLLLSLLITALVQMASSALHLRAKNLRWGVTQLLKQVHAEASTQDAEVAAKGILSHPSIAPESAVNIFPWQQYATAIRRDELLLVINDLRTRRHEGNHKDLNKTQTFLRGIAASGEALDQRVERWFTTIMDRTTERFVYQTHLWTALCAVAFAFIMHVDSLELLRRLSGDASLRARLVGMADTVLEQSRSIQETSRRKPSVASILDSVRPAGTRRGPAIPPGILSESDGKKWIRENVHNSAQQRTMDSVFSRRWAAAESIWTQGIRSDAAVLDSMLEATTISPISTPLPKFSTYFHRECGHLPFPNGHFLGVLISAFLLGLGAPFWYNLLGSLMGLRPALADKVAGGH